MRRAERYRREPESVVGSGMTTSSKYEIRAVEGPCYLHLEVPSVAKLPDGTTVDLPANTRLLLSPAPTNDGTANPPNPG